jgi:hypothetical protein
LLAHGICKEWKRIAIIDTENQSAHLYSHLGDYNVLNLTGRFTPERYMEALKMCEDAGMEVIIIDSLSHEWDGDGGILEIHSQMAGNSFTNWGKLTPRHNALVQKILASNCHVIATVRSKQDYILVEKNGKSVPEKVGMKGIQRDGLDYDFTMVFELDIFNNAICTKDRTQLFSSRISFKIDEVTSEKIRLWCQEGEEVLNQELLSKIESCVTIDELTNLFKERPDVRILSDALKERASAIRNLSPNKDFITEFRINSAQLR